MQEQNDKSIEFDFLVFIGRFQPFHRGHLSVIQKGLSMSRQLIILCGSAHQPRSTRNPWTVPERELMIRSALSEQDSARVQIAPLMDTVYNDELWVRNVQSMVQGLVIAHFSTPHRKPRIGLIGHSKDQSSFYLNLFPQWSSVEVANEAGISSTPVRERLFAEAEDCQQSTAFLHSDYAKEVLPEPVIKHLDVFINTDDYRCLQEEQAFINRYKEGWKSAPYPPTFVTVDAVVIQSGHVLLVERKARPGIGLLALPGGFINKEEKLLDACLRELREETRLKVPAPVLKGSIRKQQVFDDPFRSARGRTITHAFHIELTPSSTLPKVKGGDDARHALWIPLSELDPSQMFEDHYFIIQELTGM